MYKRLFPLFLIPAALFLTVSMAGCSDSEVSAGSRGEETPTSSLTRVETLEMQVSSFEDVITLTGSVEALNDATLSAQASGTITQLVDRGTQVAAGARIAQIDPREEQASLDQLQAQFNLAEDRLERQRPLYQDSIISAIEFEQIQAEYNRTKAALEEARQRVDKTRITTPFAGSVEERFVERGEQVSPGTPIARVVGTNRVRVRAGVPERYANDIQQGTSVTLDFRRYGAGVRKSTVTFTGQAISPDTRTFPIEVELDNSNGRLKPEMVASVRVTRSTFDDALVVPRTAVVRDELGTHLYLASAMDSVHVVEKRDIVLGPSYGEKAVVQSGLETGESVIVVGQNNVAPGDTVNVTQTYTTLDAAGLPYEGPDTEGFGSPEMDSAEPDVTEDAPAQTP
ncbi:efflux transporter periplasmic adaptor subunit [Longibacter salinarum]|uniref:Efflux transporter periplasmic adaptor subunit n=1 Tax=Longibacter salinarum TaxID=1850348 RepID=A0A2A8CTI6_9BACT|nr:efflux RND transporter periplasmic adaptor subunit [Longibacter salinarum]PEN10389.1 efflux transporter periplasmic adaptor subunit [Longibacter salinarum]